jgi:hypothetical protein
MEEDLLLHIVDDLLAAYDKANEEEFWSLKESVNCGCGVDAGNENN